MARPKKSAVASRANGGMSKNKGKPADVKEELFGGYNEAGGYVIKTTQVRRKMAKGEVRILDIGCEHDVFTYCLYHGYTMEKMCYWKTAMRARAKARKYNGMAWTQPAGLQLRREPC